MNRLGPHLQQIEKTYVQHRGRKLSYFGGCDYFRLSHHPSVLKALHRTSRQFGLNVSASRLTTGNHPLYERLEKELAEFFGVSSAILVSSGYAANMVAAQVLSPQASHVLIDEKAHASLQDATCFFNCPVLQFRHKDAKHVSQLLRKLRSSLNPVLLTDGMFSHDGSIAPLKFQLDALPKHGTILVDDAHAAGILGKRGRGSIEHCKVPKSRFVQCITLSKALGVYGGAVLGPAAIRQKAVNRSRWFAGNTPIPLPIAGAALESLNILRENPALRQRLLSNISYVKSRLKHQSFSMTEFASPIISVVPQSREDVSSLKRKLYSRDIFPPLIMYPGGPELGNFRFALSSEHTQMQLDALVSALETN